MINGWSTSVLVPFPKNLRAPYISRTFALSFFSPFAFYYSRLTTQWTPFLSRRSPKLMTSASLKPDKRK